MTRKLLHIVFLFWSFALFAEIPKGYYDNAVGKKSAALKTAVFQIVRPHTMLEYYSSATSFRSTDWHPNGYFWDMYSNNQRTTWSGLNREHNLPKSWFGISSGNENTAAISTDLHNLYPSDPTANEAKSNYALGVVGGTSTFSNGVVKVGQNTYAGYTGFVFEPADEYKGDFARCYMYMVTSYEDYSTVWQSIGTSSMLQRNTFPVLNSYATKLLLEWHRNDPVSTKEINRNEAVYNLQGNRNPFVDHPVLAEYIWGKFVGEAWDGTTDLPETKEPLEYVYNSENQSVFVRLNNPVKAIFKVFTVSGVEIQTGGFSLDSTIELRNTTTGQFYDKGVYVLMVYAGGQRKTIRLLVY